MAFLVKNVLFFKITVEWFIEAVLHPAQADFKLAMWPKMTWALGTRVSASRCWGYYRCAALPLLLLLNSVY